MLLEELEKKSKQKPEFDREKYYEWQLQQDGGRQLCQPHPVLWKSHAGQKTPPAMTHTIINVSVAD